MYVLVTLVVYNTRLIFIDLQSTKRQRSFNFYWNRVADSQAPDLPVSLPLVPSSSESISLNASNVPQVPKIRTTSPDEDLINEHASSLARIQRPSIEQEKRLIRSHSPKTPIPPSLTDLRQKKPDVARSNVGPRRFHFIKSSSFMSSRTIDPANKVKKHRKSRRSDLPVFIEKLSARYQVERIPGVLPRIVDDTMQSIDQSSATEVYEQRPRKRPMVNAAEQKWRIENWDNSTKADSDTQGKPRTAQSIKEPSSQWDLNSEVLAEQLQEVVFQEMNAVRATPENDKTARQLKVQPKPPKPRQFTVKQNIDAFTEDESTMDVIDNEHEDNYVYDTYVRSVADGSIKSSEENMNCLQDIDNSKIGILIIAEEDQEEWETFAEGDQDSDKDWNSEEEDENGSSKSSS